MKKGIIPIMVAACASAFIVSSCGEKFTPMTQDQINAKVDSLYNAQKDAKMQELTAACQATLDQKVDQKVEEMKNAETASK
ncbi:MAG TPA: hypothetical protein VG603_13090 [Chitinophagales bacterium]|nr:hypothetical protein [Chitinophagales bacterium]